MKKELIKLLADHSKYQLRLENWSMGDEPPFEMVAAYGKDGGYIGNLNELIQLVGNYGIAPQKSDDSHDVCSIGFSDRDNKWYGWSHRAIFGFGIGNITEEGDCQNSSGWTEEYLVGHPEERDKVIPVGFECKTLDDCKRVAIAFAASIS